MIAATIENAPSASLLLRDRVRTLFRHLPKALGGDEESVHQMRVAGRRLRVALRLLATKPRGPRVRRCLRALRALVGRGGGSRDLDVGLNLLETHLATVGSPDAAVRQVLGRLRAARTRGRNRMVEDLLDHDLVRLRRDLRAIVDRGGEGYFAAAARVRTDRDLVAAEIGELLVSASQGFPTEVLHRLRTRARRLRYIAEVADRLRGQTSMAPALFRGLQERLGNVHDAFILSRWLGHQAAVARGRTASDVAGAARDLERHFLDESQRLYQKLIDDHPASIVQQGLEAMGVRSVA